MALLEVVCSSLAWLGRHGSRAIGISIIIGIALPWLGQWCRPFVSGAVFILLSTAFMQVDTTAAKDLLRRPVLIVWATIWTSLIIPVLIGLSCHILGLDESAPELFIALMLQAVASPIMSAPALAMIMGLESTIVLLILIVSTALMPLTAPLFASIFVGPALSITPVTLALRLFLILFGAALTGIAIRKLAGSATIERNMEAINGFNILILFVYVAAVMESVGGRFLADPVTSFQFLTIAFAVFFAVMGLSTVSFLFAGRKRALSIGMMVSQRNMALMLAATGGSLPELAWLYFAFAQFPIFLSPQLLHPLIRHLLKQTRP